MSESKKVCGAFKNMRECIMIRAMISRMMGSPKDTFGSFIMGFTIGLIEAAKAIKCFPGEAFPTPDDVANMTDPLQYDARNPDAPLSEDRFARLGHATLGTLRAAFNILTLEFTKNSANNPGMEESSKNLRDAAKGDIFGLPTDQDVNVLKIINKIGEALRETKAKIEKEGKVGPVEGKGNGTLH